MFKLKNLIRPNIRNLTPYSSAREDYKGDEGIFLDANENAFGSVIDGDYNRYPDPFQKQLKAAMTAYFSCNENQIFLGNGSDEAIDLLFRVFCEPGKDNIILLPPTYGMYEVLANVNNIAVKKVNLTDYFQPDVEQILKFIDSHTKLIFVCSPNNPTANLIEKKAIEKLLLNFNGIVVVDEAYIDFAPVGSVLSKINQHPNLVVLRTFSKAWGLAALRLGMAFTNEEIIQVMNKIKHPYNINLITQQLAIKALKKQEKLKATIKNIIKAREQLSVKLEALSFVQKVFPSDANFLLVKMENPKAVYTHLVNQKIIVRDRSNVTLCEGCLRITVGTEEENEVLINCLTGL